MLVPVALLLCFATALIPCHAEQPAPVDSVAVVECDTTILITNSDFPGIKIWWTPPCDTTYVPVEP